MKSQKGITLISLTIYVIVMVVLVAIITTLTAYFYKNVDTTSKQDDINKQYTKFLSYFSEEINREENEIVEIDQDNKYIIFSSGNQYTFVPENEGIYQGMIKIVSNIENCKFEKVQNDDNKIKVTIKGNNGNERVNTFTMKTKK